MSKILIYACVTTNHANGSSTYEDNGLASIAPSELGDGVILKNWYYGYTGPCNGMKEDGDILVMMNDGTEKSFYGPTGLQDFIAFIDKEIIVDGVTTTVRKIVEQQTNH